MLHIFGCRVIGFCLKISYRCGASEKNLESKKQPARKMNSHGNRRSEIAALPEIRVYRAVFQFLFIFCQLVCREIINLECFKENFSRKHSRFYGCMESFQLLRIDKICGVAGSHKA